MFIQKTFKRSGYVQLSKITVDAKIDIEKNKKGTFLSIGQVAFDESSCMTDNLRGVVALLKSRPVLSLDNEKAQGIL